MSQNIYDNPEFFKKYMKFPRSQKGLDGAPEWSSLSALLPDPTGLKIVDLGCGLGWFARYARQHGAASVEAVDISETMIEEARRRTDDRHIRYRVADLEVLELPERQFDLAFSSLAFHYLRDFDRVARTIYQSLQAGSFFVFSIEHPIFMAPSCQDYSEMDGRTIWPLDNYLVEGKRNSLWLETPVTKYHRTLGTTLNSLVAAGFDICHVEEWRPDAAQLKVHPEWQVELNRPMYLLIKARKPDQACA